MLSALLVSQGIARWAKFSYDTGPRGPLSYKPSSLAENLALPFAKTLALFDTLRHLGYKSPSNPILTLPLPKTFLSLSVSVENPSFSLLSVSINGVLGWDFYAHRLLGLSFIFSRSCMLAYVSCLDGEWFCLGCREKKAKKNLKTYRVFTFYVGY